MAEPAASLLDLVYETAVDPGLWPAVLERLGDLVGAEAANMSRLNVTTGEGAAVVARVDPAVLGDYFSYFAQRNPLLAVDDMPSYLSGWSPTVITDEDILPRSEFVRSEYFTDFMKPISSDWLMMIRLSLNGPKNDQQGGPKDDLEVASIAVGRGDRRGRFSSRERAMAERVQPHLIRAYQLGRRLALSGRLGTGAPAGLDALGHAVLMLKADGRVGFANPAAERLLRQDRRLKLEGGRLAAADLADGPRFQRLIARAASRNPAEREGGDISLRAPGRSPLAVTVAPMRPEALSVFVDGPVILVTIAGADRAEAAALDGEAAHAKLTKREWDCLALVAQGKSDWEISVILGISEATARFHVDNARKKLGAVNRAHAVAKLAGRASF